MRYFTVMNYFEKIISRAVPSRKLKNQIFGNIMLTKLSAIYRFL